MASFERILVPSDLSKCSRKALRLAISMAVRFDAQLFLLYVVDGGPQAGAWLDNERARTEIESLETDERSLLREFEQVSASVEQETGLPPISRERLRIRVAGGNPATEILKAAEEAQIDLIIMGTHGRTTIKEFFVGSTTERIVERANCSVLAVKPEGYPWLRD